MKKQLFFIYTYNRWHDIIQFFVNATSKDDAIERVCKHLTEPRWTQTCIAGRCYKVIKLKKRIHIKEPESIFSVQRLVYLK